MINWFGGRGWGEQFILIFYLIYTFNYPLKCDKDGRRRGSKNRQRHFYLFLNL